MYLRICLLLLLFSIAGSPIWAERDARAVFADIIMAEKEDQEALVEELGQFGDDYIKDIYEAWRTGGVYSISRADQTLVLQFTEEQQWQSVRSGEIIQLTEEEAAAAEKERPARSLRRMMKSIIDTLGLKSDDSAVRIDSAIKMGRSQDADFLSALKGRLEVEDSKDVKLALREAIAISLLANGSEIEILASIAELEELKSIPSRAYLEKVLVSEVAAERAESPLASACKEALVTIESHIKRLEFFGSFFRGMSTGSVLLIVSFGLAITFGLMGIINMAHGEFVAIGGYTTFIVQQFYLWLVFYCLLAAQFSGCSWLGSDS